MKKISILLNVIIITASAAIQARTINVAIASTNEHKIAAVRDAFTLHFANDSIQIISCKAESNISEQPIGKNNALLGAQNRLANIPASIREKAEFLVAIENYIEALPQGKTWQDCGLILINEPKKSSQVLVQTQPVFIPSSFVEEAQRQSVQTTHGISVTAGSIVKQKFSNPAFAVDAHDWHSLKEFGGVSRKQLLQDAVSKGLFEQEITFLKSQLTYHLDFPKKGITFVDIFPLLRNANAFQVCLNILAQRYQHKSIDVIVGLESRGFLFGTALAARLGIGFVPVRKPNKLPGEIYSVTYNKEYGTDTLTIAADGLQRNQRALLVDDLIATGGSARAAIELVRKTGAIPVEFFSLAQVAELAEMVQLDIPLFALM